MSTTEERLAKMQPQRIMRYVEVCDKCHTRNPFRIYRNIDGILYARCNHCGRNAVITLVIKANSHMT